MTRGRFVPAAGLVVLLSGTAACSAPPVSAAPTRATASPSSSSASPSASGTPSADPAGLTAISVPGYAYTAPPSGMAKMPAALDATGMVTSFVARGVRDSNGAEVGAIIVSQYNPKLTVMLDKLSPKQLSDATLKMAKAMIPGNPTVTTQVRSGVRVLLVQDPEAAMTVVYRPGGHLIEVAGPKPGPVLDFTTAYLAASASR